MILNQFPGRMDYYWLIHAGGMNYLITLRKNRTMKFVVDLTHGDSILKKYLRCMKESVMTEAAFSICHITVFSFNAPLLDYKLRYWCLLIRYSSRYYKSF